MPRWIDAGRVTFKYGLGEEFITVLRVLHKLGPGQHDPGQVGRRGRRYRRATSLPRYCPIRRNWVTGCPGKPAPDCGSRAPERTAQPRQVYLYHVVDNEWSMREYGAQAVVWQTALNPVVAMELLATGAGRVPVCSARKRFRPSLSWIWSTNTVRRGGSARAADVS